MDAKHFICAAAIFLGLLFLPVLNLSAQESQGEKKNENDLNRRMLEAMAKYHENEAAEPKQESKSAALPKKEVEEKPVPKPVVQPKTEEPVRRELKPAIVTERSTEGSGNQARPDDTKAPKPKVIVPNTYTIQAGDTLSGIAHKLYGDEQRWVAIAKANPLVDPIRLKIGQIIKLPDLQSDRLRRKQEFTEIRDAVTSHDQKAQYVLVEPGDTLSGIAYRTYGKASMWRLIYEANRDQLRSPDLVRVGMKLKVPPPPNLRPEPKSQVQKPTMNQAPSNTKTTAE